jgi:hypothetical protein
VFPSATIVRPPPMFGAEDRLLNPLGAPRFYWSSSSLDKPTFKPAYVCIPCYRVNSQVNDVALALELMMHDNSTAGQTFDLAGPKTFTREDLLAFVEKYSYQKPKVVHLPKALKLFLAAIRNRVSYWHVPGWTPDEIVREHIDHVHSTVGPNGESVLGWTELPGMTALEPLDGLIIKTQLRNFQRGLASTPQIGSKSLAERAREAEMNKIL